MAERQAPGRKKTWAGSTMRRKEESRHRAEESPAVGLVLFKTPGKQRNERNGNIAPRQQIVQKVRNDEGREVNVGLAPCTELPGNDLVAEKPHETRNKNTERHDKGGRAHFLP